MSFFLSVQFKFSRPEIADRYRFLLDSKTRLIFSEDVPAEMFNEYAVIDSLEYPDKIDLDGVTMTVTWRERQDFGFENLIPMFELGDAKLNLAYEIPSYAMSSEHDEDTDGWFWIIKSKKIRRVNRSDALVLISPSLVKALSE